jgi:hypothetical protein
MAAMAMFFSCLTEGLVNKILKNVMSEGKTRRKGARKRSLHGSK